ncbi:RsmB/NOP family class I SAM-dependent RNA methyltransferase [Sphingosinicella sp. CPCC 101087]|uniref:RsmB/NOP family class I SAM-dependent RNA methyltransferase n=1 Tax=Sphingosinicella sp. CPCC 101087 TaxID=2497754 RepID=UPI00101D3099|nr:RsmB/NOP family class I SAM-dependent RNA methyltransferase [Sphingosinicella sp. CPCC 101087]
MTPAARTQAAIELLDEIIVAARESGAAADTIVARYFRTRRYAGAKDRRAVRDLVFRAVRRAGERPASGRAAMIGLAREDPALLAGFDGSAHGAAPIQEDESGAEAGIAPAWLVSRFDPLVTADELPALLERAPLDLRANRLRGTREAALDAVEGAVATPHSPIGLRLAEATKVEDSQAWHSGLVEVQDEGSQLICLACGAAPGMLVIDLCAGAGGKTLALAGEMADQGRILACDTDRGRLSRIAPRLGRAGVSAVETRLLDPGREAAALEDLAGAADIVLVDAPCSGTGTWRRNPETRWRVTPERLDRLTKLQAHLLDLGGALLKPGGLLVYAVCSLLSEEGRDQAEAMSARSSLVPEPVLMAAGRVAGPGRLLGPAHDGTDGFFVARWHRPC